MLFMPSLFRNKLVTIKLFRRRSTKNVLIYYLPIMISDYCQICDPCIFLSYLPPRALNQNHNAPVNHVAHSNFKSQSFLLLDLSPSLQTFFSAKKQQVNSFASFLPSLIPSFVWLAASFACKQPFLLLFLHQQKALPLCIAYLPRLPSIKLHTHPSSDQ